MTHYPLWAWIVFGAALLVLLTIDIFSHRTDEPDSHRRAVFWTIVWVGAGLLFNGFIWVAFGSQRASEYLAAYLIEKSLSLDNIFVFLVIFRSLDVPRQLQRTALLWGVFGALVFRAIFILLGAEALDRWRWVSYVFGAILLAAAWHVFREDPAAKKDNAAVRWLSKHIPVTHELRGHEFFTRQDGRILATPLLLAVVGLELTDILFAVDSVPAALAITRDRYIVYSSNAFAILGLRSLYLVLAGTIAELRYLHYGLAGVLVFAAFKLVTAEWIHVPALVSVAIIAVIIGAALGASLLGKKPAKVS